MTPTHMMSTHIILEKWNTMTTIYHGPKNKNLQGAAIARAERESYIIQQRINRVSFRDIALKLGVSHTRVMQIFAEVRDRIPAQHLAHLRAEEAELADKAITNLLTIAENEKVRPSSRIEAWRCICVWSAHKSALFGAFAPTRKEITVLTEDVVDAALRKASEEFEASARVLEELDARAAAGLAELGEIPT